MSFFNDFIKYPGIATFSAYMKMKFEFKLSILWGNDAGIDV